MRVSARAAPAAALNFHGISLERARDAVGAATFAPAFGPRSGSMLGPNPFKERPGSGHGRPRDGAWVRRCRFIAGSFLMCARNRNGEKKTFKCESIVTPTRSGAEYETRVERKCGDGIRIKSVTAIGMMAGIGISVDNDIERLISSLIRTSKYHHTSLSHLHAQTRCVTTKAGGCAYAIVSRALSTRGHDSANDPVILSALRPDGDTAVIKLIVSFGDSTLRAAAIEPGQITADDKKCRGLAPQPFTLARYELGRLTTMITIVMTTSATHGLKCSPRQRTCGLT
ncbi:hypothetical protein EVAR_38485_1 [Eumeta japonica]|uniref:Uncharacterized protein n=1 Tax=Eumeta variegata TaxID=151549 RepID=A0A4C1WLP0_EUMVA|nr:hypothetical protein EVAR_38485_1 [Eumeta japonica]